MKLKNKALKHILVDREMKLKELSERSGVSMQTLSGVSNGKSCSYETAAKLCAALGCTINEIAETEV